MYVYLTFLLIFFLAPVALLSWFNRHELRAHRRTVLWCLVFVFTLGWLWDWLSVQTGLWWYDSAPTLGLWLDGLPVEEFLGFYLLGTLLIVNVVLLVLRRSEPDSKASTLKNRSPEKCSTT